MEESCDCGGSCMRIGCWGDSGGNYWSYKPDGPIRQIIIVHGGAIDSIMFKTVSPDGASTEYSEKFGGNGGNNTVKIDIDYPSEYLTEMNGTGGSLYPFGPWVVRSLHFKTNITQYGPFGSPGSGPFWCPIQDGAIVGFFGHSGACLDSIGVYAKPVCSLCATKSRHIEAAPCKDEGVRNDVMKMVVPRSPGAWGDSAGKQWDDGVFARVKQVVVHLTSSGNDHVIHAVNFQYENRDGKSGWSPMHGGLGGDKIERIKLDADHGEFLAGISGFYGPFEGSNGMVAIRSICFHTNKRKYGSFGRETGIKLYLFYIFCESRKGCWLSWQK